jgi:hypothetical protein
MNKLLQHIMNAGDVSDKFLVHFNNGVPLTKKPLVKAQQGIQNVTVDGKRMRTDSPEYKNLYSKGIGRWMKKDASGNWVPGTANDSGSEFVSSPKTLEEVVVKSTVKPNSLGAYSSKFYRENPFETFFKDRYGQIKDEFTSEPIWAQRAVGGWDRESRQKNIREQIQQEYDKKYSDYLTQRLLQRNPQGDQYRDDWLSNKNFTNRELSILTANENLPQPNLYSQGAQGLYNTADMLALGKLPELAVPGIAKSEVAQYNSPLLTFQPLSIPAKMVQSFYKDDYTFRDAVRGTPNKASLTEDIITDPLTWWTLGGKSLLTAAGKASGINTARFFPEVSNFSKLSKPPKTQFAQDVDDFLKAGKEVVDPETGVSKFVYELDDVSTASDNPFVWYPDSQAGKKPYTGGGVELTFDDLVDVSDIPVLNNKISPIGTSGSKTFGSTLSNIYDKGKSKLMKLFANTNQWDFSKPLGTLEDYKSWANNIHKELDYVDPALIRDAHKKAIKYFKSTGQWSDIKNSPREYGLFIRGELADKIPSFAKPVVVNPATGARFNYGKDVWHPSLYPDNQQAMYFSTVRNEADYYKDAPFAAQEAQPLSWGYDAEKFTPQEANLITGYAHGYDIPLNNVFRARSTVGAKRFYETKGNELNTAVQKNKFPVATQVRRGVDNYPVEILDPVTYKPTGVFKRRSELGVGDVFKDEGFMSTSLNTNHTWGTADASELIDIPGGGVQSYAFPNAMSNSPYFTEAEAILPKGLIRKVEEVREPVSGGSYGFPNNARIRTSILNPYSVLLPVVGGAAAIQGQKKQGGPIVDPRGQWAHPGKVTRIPGSDITMQGVNYPVYAKPNKGKGGMMYPGGNYFFPKADYVDEYPMMQRGGQYIDSVFNANRNLNWVKRLYDKNTPSIQIPGEPYPSTHYMEYADNRVYPQVVQMPDGKLKHLGKNAYDYADSTKTYIKFPTEADAKWFSQNYKKGKGVLGNRQLGGQSAGKSPYFFMNINNDMEERFRALDYVKDEYNKGMDFHTKWLNSPMYKSMINASDPANAKNITDQRKDRLSAVTMKYVDTPYGKAGAATDQLGNIEVYPAGVGAKGIGVHEISHVTDTGYGLDLIPAKDKIDISRYSLASENIPKYKAYKEYFNYVTRPSETRARLNEIRQGASENKLYDPFTQKVSPAIYNKLKNFQFNSTPATDPLQQLRSAYSDEQILEMLNSVSKVNTNNDMQNMMASGGQHGGLDRWFAEKWVDVKTGKACGRQEGESRAYPACRPSRRVSSQTPKTSSEMSPAEKAKFKRTKTSSERINYNHKRN